MLKELNRPVILLKFNSYPGCSLTDSRICLAEENIIKRYQFFAWKQGSSETEFRRLKAKGNFTGTKFIEISLEYVG